MGVVTLYCVEYLIEKCFILIVFYSSGQSFLNVDPTSGCTLNDLNFRRLKFFREVQNIMPENAAQLHSTKPEFRFWADQNLLVACQRCAMLRILLRQWPRLEIK